MKATSQTYVLEIKQILNNARKKAYSAVNTAMIEAYWLVGKRIVEEEQNGNKKANYGKEILVNLSNETVTIEDGERVAQFVFCKVEQVQLNEVAELNESTRGAGGFGSTGVK